MKKYLIPFAATFIFLATMSFTVITKNGAFHGKLKQSDDCFAYSDYTSHYSNCSGALATLPATPGPIPYDPASCNYSVKNAVGSTLFPSTFDVDQELTCTGSNTPCCFTVTSGSGTCSTCYVVNDIWYEN